MLDPQLTREIDAPEVDTVLAILGEPLSLLSGPRLERRAKTAARE
jgi:hypothetical protein